MVSFVANDFDNGDALYGIGDTLTVVFDLATDRGGTDILATAVPVEDMLSISHNLGAEVLVVEIIGYTHAKIGSIHSVGTGSQ